MVLAAHVGGGQSKIQLSAYYKTFRLPKNEGVNKWKGEWHIQRNIKKSHENNNMSTLTSLNNTLENAMNVGIF